MLFIAQNYYGALKGGMAMFAAETNAVAYFWVHISQQCVGLWLRLCRGEAIYLNVHSRPLILGKDTSLPTRPHGPLLRGAATQSNGRHKVLFKA